MAHKLQIYVRDSFLDARSLIVSDLSQYDDMVPVENHALHIQLPGFDDAVPVHFTLGGTTGYAARNFAACGHSETGELPDGLYTLTYSVAPNTRVFTVVHHFRAVQLEKRLYSLIARMSKCPDPHCVDTCGNVIIEKEENVLLKALLLFQGLKGNMCLHGDYVGAQNIYREVGALLAGLKECC